MSYPRHQLARSHKFVRRATSNITLNSTTWANVDTGLDLTLAAQIGDVLEAGLVAVTGAEAVSSYIDVATIVSASPVNYFATAGGASGQGVLAWVSQGSVTTYFGGSILYTVVPGDISAGAVTCRLRYRTSVASGKTLYSGTDIPIQFFLKNLGPADPN